MNDDEQVKPEEIHEAIGLAATYLMNSHMPVKASTLIMVLRAQGIMATQARQKRIFEAARVQVMAKVTHPA